MATRTALGTAANTGVTSLSVPISAAINAGDLVLVLAVVNNGGTITCSDGSNTYTQRVIISTALCIFDVINATARPVNTNITVSTTGAAGLMAVLVLKWSAPTNTLADKTAGQQQSNTTAPSSGNTANTAAFTEIWCGVIWGPSAQTLTPGAGWTLGQTALPSTEEVYELYQETAGGGPANANGTWSTSEAFAISAVSTYNEQIGGGGSGRVPNLPTLPALPTLGSIG